MDWRAVKIALCEGRQFTETAHGFSVIADTMMPSGAVIEIFLQADHDVLRLHDNGAAFDEIARHGREATSMVGLRNLMSKSRLRVDDCGAIFMDRLAPEKVAVGVAILADASLRAAQFLTSHSKLHRRQPLDTRLQDALRLVHREGRKGWQFQGRHRQHRFDFGFMQDGRTVLVDAVNPDPSSVNSAVVKSLDAARADQGNARPVLVYDAADGWPSGLMNLLGISGAECVSIDAVTSGHLLAA